MEINIITKNSENEMIRLFVCSENKNEILMKIYNKSDDKIIEFTLPSKSIKNFLSEFDKSNL